MDRRTALAKATLVTADATAGLLDPEQSSQFIWALKDKDTWGSQIRFEPRTVDAGEINKASTATRIIRGAPENADDGYRVGAAFGVVPYQTVKVRLPWEVTEDVFHSNIEREALEADLTTQMTRQFGADLSDLEINGDTAAGAGPDQAFLQINDGVLKQIVTANVAGRRINGGAITAGAIGKAHFFAAVDAMPTKYLDAGALAQGNGSLSDLRWIINPRQIWNWLEYRTDRTGDAGDNILDGNSTARTPLGIPFLPVAAMPMGRMLLANPRNFVRVVSWEVRKRRVTGETDMELAAKDKRFYIFFIKHDVVIEETDAVVDVYGLV